MGGVYSACRLLGRSLLLFSAGLLGGCLVVPADGKAISGTRVVQEQLAFIETGVTTTREVVSRLGEPDVIWVQERIAAYTWTTREAWMPWVIVSTEGAVGGVEEFTRGYMLLIQYGEDDRVSRHEITTRNAHDSFGEHLKKWARFDGSQP